MGKGRYRMIPITFMIAAVAAFGYKQFSPPSLEDTVSDFGTRHGSYVTRASFLESRGWWYESKRVTPQTDGTWKVEYFKDDINDPSRAYIFQDDGSYSEVN